MFATSLPALGSLIAILFERVSGRHLRQIFLFLLVRRSREALSAGDDTADAEPPSREFFGDNRVRLQVHPESAVLLVDENAEKPHLPELVDEFGRHLLFLRVAFARLRANLVRDESLRFVAQ